MKKSEIVVGQEYLAKVSGTLQRVRVTREDKWSTLDSRTFRVHRTRWEATNLKTGRTITIKSAQRLRPIPFLPRTVDTEATVRVYPRRG